MKNKWIVTLVMGALCGMAQAALVVNVDLGRYDVMSGNWNSVGNSATNLVDWNTGSQTALGIICSGWDGTAGTDGWPAGQNVGWVDAKAANDYLFMYQDMFGDKTGKITLYGLTDGQEYRLQLVSSENYWGAAPADFKAGGRWASADYQGVYNTNIVYIGDNWSPQTAYNTETWLIWSSVYSSGGSLELTVTTTAGMNAAVVNALRVEAIPEPASALLIGCGAALIAVVRRFYGHA